MNDHLKISPHGLRLIQDFEGAPRLKARLCEGGKYELGWGCTYYPDNSPVKEGDTIDLSFAPVMLQHAATVTENAVKRLVHIPLTQPQFDGLCGFVYNVGEANAATSTVIRETNAGRFEDAAAAFGMWVFATKAGYKQALRGLLRRRYAEACTYLGYHYTEACADEAVALQREKPAKLPGADRVLYKTPFANILRVAQHYPLPESPEPAHAQSPVLVPTVLERVEVAPAPLQDSAIPTLQATIDGIPTQLPLPGEVLEDELVLEQPAASEASADVKGSPPVSPQPIPAAVPSDSNPAASPAGSPAPSLDPKPPNAPKAVPVSPLPAPSAPVGKPKDPPPVIAGQDGAKPKSPWTVQPEEVHYKIDPGAGLKPLEDSDRAKAFYWQRTFMFVIYLGGAGLFGSTFMAGSTALMKHAALMSVLLDLIVPLAIALSGLVLGAVGKSWADWRRQRAQTRASQGLY
ncbi:MAG: glycoside hydrolase family protein [Hyphomonadaceae bacterium]|nr:glycoside hydrolase family protein [Hyphomonadaceae bacterium]